MKGPRLVAAALIALLALASQGVAQDPALVNAEFITVKVDNARVRVFETVLKPGGVFVIEMHYLLDMIEQVAFDTIYHEHVSYWALGPMKRFFEAHGMTVVDAERVPLHHGQLRVHVQRHAAARDETGEQGCCAHPHGA